MSITKTKPIDDGVIDAARRSAWCTFADCVCREGMALCKWYKFPLGILAELRLGAQYGSRPIRLASAPNVGFSVFGGVYDLELRVSLHEMCSPLSCPTLLTEQFCLFFLHGRLERPWRNGACSQAQWPFVGYS